MDSIIVPPEVVEEADNSLQEDRSVNLQNQLEQFRDQWQRELRGNSPSPGQTHRRQGQIDGSNKEEEARSLFICGIEQEQEGNMNEAIRFYRRAIQLVPDIEFKIDFRSLRLSHDPEDSGNPADVSPGGEEPAGELMVALSDLSLEEMGSICQPEAPQRMTHISQLPLEVLMYIFKWVVTEELDMRGLEVLSQVCHGFYLCARDEELWKLACKTVWGTTTASLKKYTSWRRMFIERPHVHCHGCYISRAQYIRHGERGMDSYYHPFHLVQYYRYIRFFADGRMFMLCTPDEPVAVLPKLRSRHSQFPGLMYGHYWNTNNRVSGVLRRVRHTEPVSRFRRRQQQANQNDPEQLFYVELNLTNQGKRFHTVLEWVHYSMRNLYREEEETLSQFDLNKKAFPSMYFSRIKSYTAMAEVPLGNSQVDK